MLLLVCWLMHCQALDSALKKPYRVAYQGVPGAYSEMAACKACPNAEPVPCEQFEVAFQVTCQQQRKSCSASSSIRRGGGDSSKSTSNGSRKSLCTPSHPCRTYTLPCLSFQAHYPLHVHAHLAT